MYPSNALDKSLLLLRRGSYRMSWGVAGVRTVTPLSFGHTYTQLPEQFSTSKLIEITT